MRDSRNKTNSKKNLLDDKITLYSIIGITGIILIIMGILIFTRGSDDSLKYGNSNTNKITGGVTNSVSENTESASTQIGKSVNEAQENSTNTTNTSKANTTNTSAITNTTNTTSQTNNSKNTTNLKTTNTTATKNNAETTASLQSQNKEENKQLSFIKPVDGDITTNFSKDELVYSLTLDEWTTHLGIDIKADKTTVVKAAEAGTVKSIKNDPRYGLTIVIDHGDGIESVYSNLLTSEFVVEGEKVDKGQTIGTVGNTAAFEIADEPHLHFEIWKNSEPVDPNTFIN